jgi:transposase
VAENLRVKEVVVGEGERRRCYVVCHNPQEEKRQRAHRWQILRELEAELASLKEGQGESHSKRVCQLRASRRYGRYVRLTKGGLLRIDAAKRRAEEQLDGKFVVHSNDDSLSPTDLALGYKQLQRVEEAWRTLKSGLRLRPVYHWAVHRIHAHVALSVLALLLERVIEQACGDTWRTIRAELEQIKLAQLLSPHGEVWQVTEPSPEAAKHLQCLEMKNPPAVLHLT